MKKLKVFHIAPETRIMHSRILESGMHKLLETELATLSRLGITFGDSVLFNLSEINIMYPDKDVVLKELGRLLSLREQQFTTLRFSQYESSLIQSFGIDAIITYRYEFLTFISNTNKLDQFNKIILNNYPWLWLLPIIQPLVDGYVESST